MNNFRLPGGVWVALLLIGGILLNGYDDQISALIHLPVETIAVIAGVLFTLAKTISPTDQQLTNAVDVIRQYEEKERVEQEIAAKEMASRPRETIRGAKEEQPYIEAVPVVDKSKIPPRPNKWAKALIG